MAGNRIRDEGAKALAEALKSNKTLQTLYLFCTGRVELLVSEADPPNPYLLVLLSKQKK